MKHIRKFNEEMDLDNREPDVLDWANLVNPQLEHEYMRICHDIDAVRDALENGLDPNFNNLLGPRIACKGTWRNQQDVGESDFEIFKLFSEHGSNFSERCMAAKWAAEYGRYDILEYLLERVGITNGVGNAISWLKHSKKISDESRAEIIAYLKEKMEEYDIQ